MTSIKNGKLNLIRLISDLVRRVKEFWDSPSFTFSEKNIPSDLLSSMFLLLPTSTSSYLTSLSAVSFLSLIPPKLESLMLSLNVDLLVLRLSWLLVINPPLLPLSPDKSTSFLKPLELLMKLLNKKIFPGKKLPKSVMPSLFTEIRSLNPLIEKKKKEKKSSTI